MDGLSLSWLFPWPFLFPAPYPEHVGVLALFAAPALAVIHVPSAIPALFAAAVPAAAAVRAPSLFFVSFSAPSQHSRVPFFHAGVPFPIFVKSLPPVWISQLHALSLFSVFALAQRFQHV